MEEISVLGVYIEGPPIWGGNYHLESQGILLTFINHKI